MSEQPPKKRETHQNQWHKASNNIMRTAKWLKRDTMVKVNPSVEPVEVTLTGRYGERQAYIIETVDYGLIYVTPIQLVKIARLFGDNFGSPMDVRV